jgi:hypothetical protein
LELSEDANANGNPVLAARILAWIQYMPEISSTADGRPYKYTMSNPVAPHNLELLKQAVTLDPHSGYLQSAVTYLEGSRISKRLRDDPKNIQVRSEFSTYINKLSRLTETFGESLWPYIYVAMIGANERLGRYDEAYKALEVSRNFEPHYLDYDKLLQDMKRRQSMKLF